MSDEGLFVVLLFAIFGLLYFVPTMVAFRRRHPNRWAILGVNAVLGSTVIGWVAALIWALHAVHRSDQPGHSHGGESGLNVFVNDVKLTRFYRRSEEGSVSSIVTQIERLRSLHEEGHLTAAEYQVLKSKVLSG